MSARQEVLRRIRTALRDVPPDEEPHDVAVPRDYVQNRQEARAVLVERFCERVADYRATIERTSGTAIAGAIAAVLARQEAKLVGVPDDLPEAWLPSGVDVRHDADLGVEALDGIDGVLTGCAVAIADTGSIVLDAGPAQGRRALTLVPDLHVCVVRAEQIVAGVPEAIAWLEEAVRAGRPLTFVSGPSATSDIELNRVEGVHGPRTLSVLVIVSELGPG